MNYIERTKSDGEKIIKIFKLNILVYIPIIFQFIIGILLLITSDYLVSSYYIDSIKIFSSNEILKVIRIISILIIIKSVYSFLLYKTLNMGLTNKRVVYKKGIIGRDTKEIRLDAAESALIEQSIMGRLFGYGTVIITGRGESLATFEDIDNPIKIKVAIESAINKYGIDSK